ncbi:MAG: hypothetical protein ACRD1Y_03180 [Terriglobales bacterium]
MLVRCYIPLLIAAAASARRRNPVAHEAALAKCGLHKFSWFDGYAGALGQGNTEGASGTITRRVGAACGSVPNPTYNAVSSWVMIASDGSPGGYVQSGTQAGYGQCLTYFAQTRRTNSYAPQTKYGGCISADGSTHSYNEQYGTGCGCEYAKIDGTVWMTTSWNPLSNWTYPFQPQLFGEANYRESDIPGTSGSPTSYASLQGQNGSNNKYYSWSCNGFLKPSNNTLYHRSDGKQWWLQTTSCPAFEIWTG